MSPRPIGHRLRYHSWPIFNWIPPGGYVPFATSPLQWAEHLILPWIVLAVVSIGFYARVVRASIALPPDRA